MLRPKRVAFLLLALTVASLPAQAQTGGMPAEIESKIAEMGAVIDPPAAAKLYAPLQEEEPYQGIKVARDLKYGPDARHALDLFAPDAPAGTPRPVLVYVHGGAFTGGNKRAAGSPFHDNIALFAARNGFIGVIMTYRLAPQHPWPAGAQDISAALRWLNDNVAAHGGDPARVVLMGHSAGAVHVATYLAHGEFHGPSGPGLAGAILVSGLYEFGKQPPGPPERAYFGDDPARLAAASPLPKLTSLQLPLMVAHAKFDPPNFVEHARLLNEALCKTGRCPRFVQLAKHNHMSQVYAINTPDTELSDEIVAFVKSGK